MTGISAQGSVLIHSAPASLLPHVEWAIGRLLGGPAGLTWTPQPALASTFRTELEFDSSTSFGAVLASELLGWGSLRFEIIQHESLGVAGGVGHTRLVWVYFRVRLTPLVIRWSPNTG